MFVLSKGTTSKREEQRKKSVKSRNFPSDFNGKREGVESEEVPRFRLPEKFNKNWKTS